MPIEITLGWWLMPLATTIGILCWGFQDKFCSGYMNFAGLATVPFALFIATLSWLIYFIIF